LVDSNASSKSISHRVDKPIWHFLSVSKKTKKYIPKIKFLTNPVMRCLFSFNTIARKSEIAKKYSGR